MDLSFQRVGNNIAPIQILNISCQRMRSGQFHFHVDRFAFGVYYRPEEAREHEGVVDLVREVGTAGADYVGPVRERLLREDFGVRIC